MNRSLLDDPRRAGAGALSVLVTLATIAGNALLLGIIAKRSYLHTPSMLLMCSLTVADLLVGLLVMPLATAQVLSPHYWHFGLLICDLWHAFDVFASTVSIWSLCLISWDRYSAVKHPVSYNNTATKGRSLRRLSALWIFSGCLSFPGIAWWRFSTPKIYILDTKCIFSNSPSFTIISSLLSFYVPFAVLLHSYWRVFEAASRHEKAIRTGQKRLTRRGNDIRFRSLYMRVHRGKTQSEPDRKRSNISFTEQANISTKIIEDPATKSRSSEPPKLKKGRSQSHLGILTERSVNHLMVPPFEDDLLEDDEECEIQQFSTSSSRSSKDFLERIQVSRLNESYQYCGVREDESFVISTSSEKDNSETEAQEILPRSFSLSIDKSVKQKTVRIQIPLMRLQKNNSAPGRLQAEVIKNNSCFKKSTTAPDLIEKLPQLRTERRKSRSYFFNARPRILQEKRAAKMLGIVIGCFAFCWLPFFVINVISVFCAECEERSAFRAATWLGYLNSTLNPAIYTFFNRDLQTAVIETLCCRRRQLNQFRRSIRAVIHNSLSVVPAMATRQVPPSVPVRDDPFSHLRPEIIGCSEAETALIP